MTSQFRCAKHSASCFAVCRTCWKVQALSFCLVLRCLSDVLEGSSLIILPRASLFVGRVGRFKPYHSASCFAVCRTCWKVQALSFCLVLRCLSDVLEGSSFIILPRVSLFVGRVGRFKLYHSASCFAVCRTCWKVQALSFCLVLRCLSDVLEGSSFIILPRASPFVGHVGRFKPYHSASCFAVCRTCWKVQALSFCLVLRCLSDVLEGSSFIAVWSVSYFVMLLKNFVDVIYQSLRKVCATSGPCTSTRTCFVFNGSPCLIELTRCGRK